jgi:hypothetical protein
MKPSRKLTQAIFSLFALALMSVAAMAADPGAPYPATSEVSDQKAGSVLFYNIYTSAPSGGASQNARIALTNTSATNGAFVHLFFVAENCTVADSYICLTANQTASFLASDVDPGIKGYIVAVATDANGCPTQWNYLIGDEYVKFSTGHAANLGAEAFAKVSLGSNGGSTGLVACDVNAADVLLSFDGTNYNKAPRVLAVSNIMSNLDGNSTMIIVNRVGGWLSTGAATTGTLFGILYDDAESAYSFSLTGGCQIMGLLSNSYPRILGSFTGVIGQGRSGWMKLYNNSSDFGILGASINFNQNATSQPGAFNGGHNMHKLTLTTGASVYTVPVFPPTC